MTKVTIGVPVFNAGSLLRECLENLRAQTYADFRVVIFDNHSTDETQEIALRFAQIDPRFSYHRHETNIGVWPNFAALLQACQTDYFLWRAYDDYTDPNYLEELVRLLNENPDADLAVGNISTIKVGRKRKVRNARAPSGPAHSLLAAHNFVKGARAAWIYGIWRTKVMQQRWTEVAAFYNHSWGGDFMLMFATLYQGKVAGSTRTTFYQRVLQHEWKVQDEALVAKIKAVVTYREDAQRFLNLKAPEFGKTWIERLLYRHLSRWYVNRRIYSGRKLRRWQAMAANQSK